MDGGTVPDEKDAALALRHQQVGRVLPGHGTKVPAEKQRKREEKKRVSIISFAKQFNSEAFYSFICDGWANINNGKNSNNDKLVLTPISYLIK